MVNNENENNTVKKVSKLKQFFNGLLSIDDEELSDNAQAEVNKLNLESENNIKKIENEIFAEKKKSKKIMTDNLKIDNTEKTKQIINNTSNNKTTKTKEQDEFVK